MASLTEEAVCPPPQLPTARRLLDITAQATVQVHANCQSQQFTNHPSFPVYCLHLQPAYLSTLALASSSVKILSNIDSPGSDASSSKRRAPFLEDLRPTKKLVTVCMPCLLLLPAGCLRAVPLPGRHDIFDPALVPHR